MKKDTRTVIIATTSSILGANFLSVLVASVCIITVFICCGLVFIIGGLTFYTVRYNSIESYLENLENQENSKNFIHIGNEYFDLNSKSVWIGALRTPVSELYCNYFGATDNELFYYIETDEGIEFYKSNYINYTYEMTRSFNYDEILYHKCDKLIYLGKDGETYIFDGFDLTDEVYEGEIPTYMPRYTVTAEKKDFVIKDNETGEEKRISDLKKTFNKNEHVKKMGRFANVIYVFTHNDDIYVAYKSFDCVVVLELDFNTQDLTIMNWDNVFGFDGDYNQTWYLDRVKFEE